MNKGGPQMKLRFRKAMFGALLAALCLLLSGCWDEDPLSEGNALDGLIGAEGLASADEDDAPAQITSFTLPLLSGDSLHPYTCGDGVQQTLLPLLYEGLFELDACFTPQNLLCEDYTFSADFTVWTFTLRAGVTFSDGSALTAEDAVASLQRAKTSARYGARLSSVTAIRAESVHTFSITLSEGNNRFPALLEIPILSKATLNSAVPVGTGPYVYIDGEVPYLARNGNWWQEDALPLSRIELCRADNEESLAYLFSTGAIQLLVTDYTGGSNAAAGYKGSLHVTDAQSTTMQYLGFNCQSSLFSDEALRRALSLGINRDSICQAYFSSHVQSAQFPVVPSSPWYPSELEQDYSAEAFTAAMTAAGYNEGRSHRATMLVCDGNSFRLSAAKAIAAALSVCDVSITVKALPYEEYLAALQGGSFDLYYGEVRLTPDFNCSSLVKTGGELNYGGFSDGALDAQLATAFSSASAPISANEALLSLLAERAPLAVIGFKSQSVVLQAGVVDAITPTCSNSFYQFTNWEIHIKGEPK